MAVQDSPAIREFLESLGANEGYAEELFRAYTSNPEAVSAPWRQMFEAVLNGSEETKPAAMNGRQSRPSTGDGSGAAAKPQPSIPLQAGDAVQPLRGAAARVAVNMQASLAVPTATSQRSIPVRLLEENRRLLNSHLAQRGLKLSLTPLLGWAIVRALGRFPVLNSAFTDASGEPSRIDRAHINLGLAADVETKSGTRTLLVPVVKQSEGMNFQQFFLESERLIKAARAGKLAPEDLQGATITLTNPGTLGTRASVPRLMPGQGAIVAAGAIAYPAGFEGMQEATLHALGIGKVITVSCTYDHRIIQGAESGAFLARLSALLLGEDSFYQQIFTDLNVPFHPVHWSMDANPAAAGINAAALDLEQVRKQAAVFQLVHAFRVRGHLLADVDPLFFNPIDHPELDPSHYGLTLWDLDREFLTSLVTGASANAEDTKTLTLREILEILRATYCGKLACEFMHIQRLEQRSWLQAHMEPARNNWPLKPELRRRILSKLNEAEAFERLLHARYVGHKRFSLEGGESLIPALDHLLEYHADSGGSEVLIGMAHRGRLNVLANVAGRPMNEIFSKFEDADPESVEGSGDVKYHIGAEGEYTSPSGKHVALTVPPNPSHLEAVDPVLEGSTRARQQLVGDSEGCRVLPILIHGDAAFAGQGVVAETLNLSQLEGYCTGGTVHIIINNKIGFTTSPADARSSLYSTDVARMVQAPIFHVNGDAPEAVIRAVELAFEFRRQFSTDVVIDLVCYRRHGHNEADDPSLTQPVLYRKIESHPSVRTVYAERLVREGFITTEEATAELQQTQQQLSAAASQPVTENGDQHQPPAPTITVDRTLKEETLVEVGTALQRVPQGFTVHPKLRTFLERRAEALRKRGAVDWSLAEALAFGSLLKAGVPIRMSGQDTGRGTFSQRHSVLYDYNNGSEYIPLQHVADRQARFEVHDSLLSEEAALGFEFGYSMTHPYALVLWEAQFGDFVNGAQIVIDQFLSASMTKWGRTSGLVLLLPHGYEGQGPEHSSARPERFLQLAAEDNMQVANCTTAAQYFHLLRQQGFSFGESRRPLVLLTPKSLLRHPDVASPFEQLLNGEFKPVLPDASVPQNARRVIFCSGKIYYDLLRARKQKRADTTAIVRVERLYPLPEDEIAAEIARYKRCREWLWVQEEPRNMGAWSYIQPLFAALNCPLGYAGREASASPATGSLRRHQNEQQAIVDQAIEAPQKASQQTVAKG